jgi:hypothetical protein
MVVVKDPEGERKVAIIIDRRVLGVGTHLSITDPILLVNIRDEEMLPCSGYLNTAAMSMLEKSICHAKISFEQSLSSRESRKSECTEFPTRWHRKTNTVHIATICNIESGALTKASMINVAPSFT